MQNKTNIVLISVGLIAIVAIGLAISSFQHMKKSEMDFSEKKAVLVRESLDLKDRVASIQDSLDKKTAAVDSFESEKKTLQRQIDLLKKENERIMESYATKISDINKKRAALKKRVVTLEKGAMSLSLRDAAAKETNPSIKKVIQNALVSIEMIKSGKSVTLQPLVITKPGTATPGSETAATDVAQEGELKGSILSVDRKNNLIVINLGRKDNLSEGKRCSILKDGTEIAQAEVISVRYKIAAAFIDEITYKYTISDVKEGYEVLIKEA